MCVHGMQFAFKLASICFELSVIGESVLHGMLPRGASTFATAGACQPCGCLRYFAKHKVYSCQQMPCLPRTRALASCQSVQTQFGGSSTSRNRRRDFSTPATSVTDIPLASVSTCKTAWLLLDAAVPCSAMSSFPALGASSTIDPHLDLPIVLADTV